MPIDSFWGPFPRLATAAGGLAGARRLSSRFWRLVAPSANAFWPAVTPRLSLWPAGLRPPSPSIPLPVWTERVRWFFSSNTLPRGERAAEAAVDALQACSGWLQQRILENCLSWVDPLWDQTPIELLRISPQGVFAVLNVYSLEKWGPELASRNATPAQSAVLAPDSTPGDFLALHLALEECLRRRVQTARLSPRRRTGGFRTDLDMLGRYQALRRRVRPGNWEQALDRMIRSSPLTRLVYLDVIPPADDSRGQPDYARAAAFGQLLPTDVQGDWADLYLSQLARTLVAGMLSPPATLEDREAAERAYQAALGRSRSVLRLLPDSMRDSNPAVAPFRERWQRAERLLRAAYVDRLAVLADILSSARLLRLRFLDMFVREIVAASAVDMEKAWREARVQVPRPQAARVVCSPDDDGACFSRFRDLLFGTGKNRAGSEPAVPGEGSRLIDSLRLLGPPAPLDRQQPISWVESIEGRFFRGWTELPFRQPNDRAAAPAGLLSSWIAALQSSVAIADEPAREATIEADQY